MIALLLIVQMAAADPWAGTWLMDPVRSSYNPGPTPRSVQLTYEVAGDGVKVTNTTVDAQGRSVTRTTTLKFDGKDYPYANNINADTASGRRVDPRTFETQWRKAGRPTLRQRISVSEDLKTLTVTQTGTDAAGATVRNVSVYSKPTK